MAVAGSGNTTSEATQRTGAPPPVNNDIETQPATGSAQVADQDVSVVGANGQSSP